MSWLFELIVAPVVVAGIGGLCWLAYNHPRSYKKLSSVILVAIYAVYYPFVAWSFGYKMGAADAFDFSKSNGSSLNFNNDPGNFLSVSLTCMAILAFFVLLEGIHLLKDKKDN